MLSRRGAFLVFGAAAIPAPAKVGAVSIGVCGPLEDFAKAEAYGFDYFEPSAAAIAALTDEGFDDFRRRVLASPLRCHSCNSLIRKLRVVGPEANAGALTAYLDTTLARCRAVGAEIAVWGSASSRNVPEGYSRENAWQDIARFLRSAGGVAQSHDMMFAIEPLRRQESNILNTGAEALRMVEQVRHPNVKMIIDYYHLREEKEDPDILQRAAAQIVHLHFANPNGRVWPKEPSEDPEYARFFALLKKVHYRGGLSIEGRGTFEKDAAASLAFFQRELK